MMTPTADEVLEFLEDYGKRIDDPKQRRETIQYFQNSVLEIFSFKLNKTYKLADKGVVLNNILQNSRSWSRGSQ